MEILFHHTRVPAIPTRADLSDVSDAYLLYTALPGDVELSHARRSILSSYGWVPLLNLVVELPRAVGAASSVEVSKYSFTESDGFLSFRRDGDDIEIGASFSDVAFMVPMSDLRGSLRRFRESSLEYAQVDHPELVQNRHFRSRFLDS